jgi:hypothetical protein
MSGKKKLLYVLGLGYSGSTLLGLALGTHAAVRNLGEVVNLEPAYHKNAKCTCGLKVSECSFWQGFKTHLEKTQIDLKENERWHFSDQGKREALDDRGGGLKKLKMVLGFSLPKLFGLNYLKRHGKKNEDFYNQAFEHFGVQVVVDVSKSPERLSVLQAHGNLDIYCLYLIRDPHEVYASNLKRPKTTRAKYGFKKIRESLWFSLRTRSYQRVYEKLALNKRKTMRWEDFTQQPIEKLNELCEWLSLPLFTEKEMIITRAEQHNYSGNRWLHHTQEEKIKIQSKVSNKKLSRSEKAFFKWFN